MSTHTRLVASRPVSLFAVRPWWLLGLLLALCCLLPSFATAGAKTTYRDTVEWARLTQFWHVLLDHSSGVTYNPTAARDFAKAEDGAAADLKALATRKLLSAAEAEGLQRLFHLRYLYVRDGCYAAPRTGNIDEVQAAAAASHWVVEMQLGLLRQMARAGSRDDKLETAIRANLVKELSFQERLASLQAAVPAEPKEAVGGKEEEARAKRTQEDARQRLSLLAAHRNGKFPRNREMEHLVPLVMELTKTAPPEGALAYLAAPAA